MFASMVLAASLCGQLPGSGPVRQTQAQAPSTVPVVVRAPFPGYTAAERAYLMDYGMPTLGPRAGRFDNPHPFRVVYPGPFSPPSQVWIFGVVPWALTTR